MGKPREQSTKERIANYLARNPKASLREVQRALGISSPSVVHFHLNHVGKTQAAILALADEIENYVPVAATLKGVTPVAAAKITLRMCAQLLRDRAHGDTSRDRPASELEIAETQPHGK